MRDVVRRCELQPEMATPIKSPAKMLTNGPRPLQYSAMSSEPVFTNLVSQPIDKIDAQRVAVR